MLDLLRQRQGAREVAKIIGERMELEPDGVVAKLAPRQPCPFDRVLAFLDPLLRRASSIVELRHPLGRSRQIGDDDADTRIEFARMPLDLGYHSAALTPGRRLVAEAGMKDPDMVRRSPNGPVNLMRVLVIN